ncbi:hypothetical protein MMC24_002290 [Lignoscripta atroalba]|nr:hypothetical protein [Lignoscripta atroalba]
MSSVSSQIGADAERFSLDIRQLEDLAKKAANAKERAHCPYSNFRVGAALLTKSGECITGANVENASYPVGICAETCAVAKAVSDGQKDFKALALRPAAHVANCKLFAGFPVASFALSVLPPGSTAIVPLREFCSLKLPIFMYDKNGSYVVKTLEELLPMSFGPEDLKPVLEAHAHAER